MPQLSGARMSLHGRSRTFVPFIHDEAGKCRQGLGARGVFVPASVRGRDGIRRLGVAAGRQYPAAVWREAERDAADASGAVRAA